MCKRRKLVHKQEDNITGLPPYLIGCILNRMSLFDAAKTSILSKDWRNLWSQILHLMFDHQFYDKLFNSKPFDQQKFAETISNILFAHVGPIHKFNLFIPTVFDFDDLASRIDSWMLLISLNHIRKLSIKNSNHVSYKLPSCILNCPELAHLQLYRCFVEKSTTLNKLVRIYLEKMDISNELMRALLLPSTKTLLDLSFVDCRGMENLTYRMPNLRRFRLMNSWGFNWQFFEISQSAEHCLVIEPAGSIIESPLQPGTIDLPKVLDNLCKTKDLRLNGYSLKYLAQNGVPESLPAINNYLTKICFGKFRFYRLDHISYVLCLLRSSPNLKYLEINVARSWNKSVELVEIVSILENPECMEKGKVLQTLWTIKLEGLNGLKAELLFIKLLLSHSPELRSVRIEFLSNMGEDRSILAELLRFSRASTIAEIIYDIKDQFPARPATIYNFGLDLNTDFLSVD